MAQGTRILTPDKGSSPGRVLRLLSKVTEVADQLERDFLDMDCHLQNTEKDPADGVASRAAKLRTTISIELVKGSTGFSRGQALFTNTLAVNDH